MAKQKKRVDRKSKLWKIIAALLVGSAFVWVPGKAKNISHGKYDITITINIKAH
ncbi:MAG TPA: hypothetical protein VIE65_13030 [Methylobacter sp.]|jgi:hypothetical protein